MPVSSYLLTTRPDRAIEVCRALEVYDNVLVGEIARGLFPVAVATDSEKEAKAWGEMIEAMEGVESCSLVYHNFEDTLPEGQSTPTPEFKS